MKQWVNTLMPMKHLHLKTSWLAALFLIAAATSRGGATADPDFGDEKMERFLLKANLVRGFPRVIPSSTHPMVLDLELDGERKRALFKYGHSERTDPENVEIEGTERPALDSYRHEVAAYRLDRALGMYMVPVAVIREVRTQGAVMEWISDACNEQERRERGIEPPNPRLLAQQQAVMRVFDALILNVNRSETDQLINLDDWKLHLIDHSRSFRESMELPRSFVAQPVSLSRALLTRLEELEGESLKRLLDGLVSDNQIEALLERRDKILEKVESDRAQYGDATVFQD